MDYISAFTNYIITIIFDLLFVYALYNVYKIYGKEKGYFFIVIGEFLGSLLSGEINAIASVGMLSSVIYVVQLFAFAYVSNICLYKFSKKSKNQIQFTFLGAFIYYMINTVLGILISNIIVLILR